VVSRGLGPAQYIDLDAAKIGKRCPVNGIVGQQILRAQFIADLLEGVVELRYGGRVIIFAAGILGELDEGMLASGFAPGAALDGHHDNAIDDAFGFFSGAFNPFAWQFVFFSGLYFGHKHLYRGRGMTPNHRGLIALCTVLCVLGLTMRWQLLPWPAAFQQDGWLATRRDYGAAYLINFLAFAYLVYCLATHVPRLFQWRPLAFLGQHSIQVFSFHIVAVYFLRAELARIAPSGGLARDAFGIALVAALFIPAWCHAQWQRRRGRQRGVAAACVVPSTSTM